MRFKQIKSGLFHAHTLLFLLLSAIAAHSQTGSSLVKGIVTNTSNQPVGRVSVMIRNARTNFTSGTTTDSSGIFTFTRVPSGGPYTFTFSSVGYASQTLAGYTIRENITLTVAVSLKEMASGLDQVVVVGYGTQKRKDLTGSVASVGNKDVKDLAAARIDQALLGKAAGVQVKPTSGEPGASPQIRIRGIGSISAGANPLYVVDGFPIDNIETLNPNDIESVDILKDASATAIYGSRGSNGVIIINTKRGKAGKPAITFDMYTGWQKASKIPKMKNAMQEAQYYYDGIKNRNADAGVDVTTSPDTWPTKVPPIVLDVLAGRNTYDKSALDAVLETAPQSQFDISATGGSENVKYALSGEYLHQDGIVLNSHFNRYGMRANIDAKLTDRITVKINVNPSFIDKSAIPVTGTGPNSSDVTGPIVSAIAVNPFYPLLNPDGSYFIFSGLAANGDFQNPLAVARETVAKQRVMRLLGNVSAEYRISNALRFNILLGGTVLSNKAMTFKPQLPVFFNNLATGTDSSSLITNYLAEYTLNYNRSFGKHSISGLAGYTTQRERGDGNSLSSNKYPNNLITALSATSGLITYGSSDSYEWSLISYLARINYNYDSKYYLTASFRDDGSSRFGSNHKYGIFPSAAAAWRVSEEKFLKDADWLSELKLRISYGQTGNNNIGNYQSYATVNYIKYVLGGGAIGGYGPANLANPNLTWEKQKSLNEGIDLSLLGRRLNISVDYFQSRNTDLLLNVNTPSITGFTNSLQNIGEVHNNGWEFVVSTVNLKGKFEWTTDVNLSTYRNKVVRLGPQGDPINNGTNITQIGQPIGMFYGWKVDGIFKNQAELAKGPIYNPGASDHSRVGDIRFVDVSGPGGKPDGVINSYDYTIMGSPYPDFYYGMTNRFAYKSISLSVSFQGSYGSKIYDQSRGSGASTRGRYRGYTFSNNYWKSEQDPGDGKTPRPNDAPSGGVRLNSQYFLDQGTYLRINNITLAYVLPENLIRRAKISGLRIYLSANNPFLFTKNTAFNPDVSTSNNALTPGLEANDYPLPKSLNIGLNLNF